MPKVRSQRNKKRSFYGNRYTKTNATGAASDGMITASSSKLKIPAEKKVTSNEDGGLKGNRVFDIATLVSVFSILCCPACLKCELELKEDSKYGLLSNLCLVCKCGFMKGFSSTPKKDQKSSLNNLLVLGLRLIGKGFTAGKKLFCTLNLPFLSKNAFRANESQLLKAVQSASVENMNEAAKEVRNLKNSVSCGVSVDGTWQRRGHMSLNGCVSVISIDTGKVLDFEAMSQCCRLCERHSERDHLCSNYTGSSGKMEVVGAYRIFERSIANRELQYTEYYGDGDSKGFMVVKDIYGKDSVQKLECIGHVQKRVGTRLRKLKKSKKGLGGKGKLTDNLIDKLQNYYGIAIRSNKGDLKNMQSAVIAAFFHCCSGKMKAMHGQCPKGANSWCKYQKAIHAGGEIVDNSPGLPNSIIKIIKPTYMSLCDQGLLSKCLHGMTQNNNESFNNLLWNVLPKGTFVGMQTLLLGAYVAVLLFNSGYLGLLPVFQTLGIEIEEETVKNYMGIDCDRIKNSKRHSLPAAKISRKKRKTARKSNLLKTEAKEGSTYKCGEF